MGREGRVSDRCKRVRKDINSDVRGVHETGTRWVVRDGTSRR